MSQPISPLHRRFSGRDFTEQELETIRAWISEKRLCREQLARRVCQEFGWINAAGKLKTMSCKVALLRMHRAGLIAGRDRFIGWSDSQRRARLHLVVNNNRFLIPPWVQTRNLASRLLCLVSRRIAADWLSRYDYSPVLLETFVEQERFTGTCYRAAKWIEVGTTKRPRKTRKEAPEHPASQKHPALPTPKKLLRHPHRLNLNGVHRIFTIRPIWGDSALFKPNRRNPFSRH